MFKCCMYLMYKVDIHYIHVHKIKDIRLCTARFPKQLPWFIQFLFCPPNYTYDFGTRIDPFFNSQKGTLRASQVTVALKTITAVCVLTVAVVRTERAAMGMF